MRLVSRATLVVAAAGVTTCSSATVTFHEAGAESEPQIWYEAAGEVTAPVIQVIDFSSLRVGWRAEGRRLGPIVIRSEDAALMVLDSVGAVQPGLRRLVGYASPTDSWLGFDLPTPVALVGMLLADQQASAVFTVLVKEGREFAFLVSPSPVAGTWKWLFVSSSTDSIIAVRFEPAAADEYATGEVVVGNMPEPTCFLLVSGAIATAIRRRRRRRLDWQVRPHTLRSW